ncbi:Uncharacterised protein family (UPF0158) [Lachnospiraceae bacterium C7]|nr:Uncharacterised protein family (UPF0158) [Lachnospiraceae bacterium C7]
MIKIEFEKLIDEVVSIEPSWEKYLNVETGEFLSISDDPYLMDHLTKAKRKLADGIEDNIEFVRLPNTDNINEVSIMDEFARNIEEILENNKDDIEDNTGMSLEAISEALLDALYEDEPESSFLTVIDELELSEEYNSYKLDQIRDIVQDWCNEYEIDFV